MASIDTDNNNNNNAINTVSAIAASTSNGDHEHNHPDSLQPPSQDDELSGDSLAYRTVLADPVNFNVKHPLFHSWTLWYDQGGRRAANAQSWSQNLKELVTFETVEDFWGVYNNVAKVNELQSGANYHLFKKGIRPMWEDAANAKGGKWVVQLPRSRSVSIDDLWLFTILACIGEHFEFDDEICGAVMSVRKGFNRLALWTRTCGSRDVCEKIGRQFKATLNITAPVEFQAHSDASKSGPFNKDKYVV